MKLINLTTSGFKKLDKFECNFTSGLNVIVGDNAAGKSTMLMAIEAALYGPSVLPGNKDHITTWGRERWSLQLTFQIGDSEYTVTRTKSTAKLMKGDSLEANGSSPVTKRIEELTGLSAKDYNLFIQSRQGETAGLLTFGATALARKVEEFAGVSLLDSVQSLANGEWRDGKSKSEALRPTEEQFAEAEAALERANDAEVAATFELKVAKDLLTDLESPESVVIPEGDPKALRRHARSYSAAQQEVKSAREGVEHAAATLESAKATLAETPEPADSQQLTQKISDAVAEDKELRQVRDDRRKKSDAINDAVRRIEESKAGLESITDDDAMFQDFDEEKSNLEQQLKALWSQRAELVTKLSHHEKMYNDAQCPTCGTFLSDHDPEKLEQEFRALNQQVAEVDAEIKRISVDHKNISKSLEGLRAGLQERDRLQAALEKAEAERSTLELEYAKLPMPTCSADEFDELIQKIGIQLAYDRNELSKLSEASDLYDRRKAAVDKAERTLARREDDLAEASETVEGMEPPESEEQIEKLQQAIDNALAMRQRLESAQARAGMEVDKAEIALKSAIGTREGCAKAVSDLQKASDKADAYEAQADQGGRLSRFLRDRRSHYMAEVWEVITAVASKQARNASQGVVEGLSYQGGEFLFEDQGMLAPVACASGAQKAYIGSALRIGLSRALYGNDALLIFDEPTESMTENNAMGLSSSLAGASSQVLLITHREQDQALAQNLIEVG